MCPMWKTVGVAVHSLADTRAKDGLEHSAVCGVARDALVQMEKIS